MQVVELELNAREHRALREWVSDRLAEMAPDRDSIDEESPGLLRALRRLQRLLGVPRGKP